MQMGSPIDGHVGCTHVLQEAVLCGKKAILRVHDDLSIISGHDASTLVTSSDLASDAAMKSIIRSMHPDIPILSEEDGQACTFPSSYILIDPLDGTGAYADGRRTSCVMAAYVMHGVVMACSISPIWEDDVITIHRSQIPISRPPQRRSHGSWIIGTYPYDKGRNEAHRRHYFMERVRSWGTLGRSHGSCGYHAVEAYRGHEDAFFECAIKPWDAAPISLIYEACGCRISNDPDGRPFTHEQGVVDIIAAPPEGW
jgi:fructose-1,6-bisphosphatase/inositol monophosphatase family enzyme